MNHPQNNREENRNVEVWEDLVYIKELVLSIVICSVTTLGGYFIAPDESSQPLFYGLTGALLGFIIASILIKPKRIFNEVEGEDV
ncbi:hypothetical protein [Salinibacillus xinjiangensis]|uniref:Heme ABC transporter n=1 Tax=Salinibacillus xinjiangensis TaxID=1229268 RepID=A0A6G1X461_9BACI|nr:hypothetical protein [Salinibacillus xinjiangensis]MRG85709.1 hypothetical protein [Salinibacillus xinjiangensis]